jgi:hypothetical protein
MHIAGTLAWNHEKIMVQKLLSAGKTPGFTQHRRERRTPETHR